ncbi:splicing associated factor Saf4 [Schizosaccharomyces osmophilus]|uniref:Splicing associated factor Saf4 n=1 Tax=Schizosaccharomyces osmophilus TaxID=2545709 RepID=A0AAF0AW57_9SCHI|nr:splicing associated factor Saf4 [Schizosaccharomyces osmophilus]WBW73202.1 splicing associated factor Saf4 [Schizosaccharomyces osmophilus]
MGRYRPPEEEENKRRKRTRAKNVVRFEMPFAVWCNQCQNLISQGTRFNAEKKHIGSYYSSKVWSFIFHCHTCSNALEIHTDPKNTEYNVFNGGKRKADASNTVTLSNVASSDNHDPLETLEKSITTQKTQEDQNTELELIYEKNERQWADPMTVSQKLRKRFREKKKLIKEQEQRENNLKYQAGLDLSLLPPTISDEKIAQQLARHERTESQAPVKPDYKKIIMKRSKKERFSNFDDAVALTGFLRNDSCFPKVSDTENAVVKVSKTREWTKGPEKTSTASLVEYEGSDEST